jgi:hypothetical protein
MADDPSRELEAPTPPAPLFDSVEFAIVRSQALTEEFAVEVSLTISHKKDDMILTLVIRLPPSSRTMVASNAQQIAPRDNCPLKN